MRHQLRQIFNDKSTKPYFVHISLKLPGIANSGIKQCRSHPISIIRKVLGMRDVRYLTLQEPHANSALHGTSLPHSPTDSCRMCLPLTKPRRRRRSRLGSRHKPIVSTVPCISVHWTERQGKTSVRRQSLYGAWEVVDVGIPDFFSLKITLCRLG